MGSKLSKIVSLARRNLIGHNAAFVVIIARFDAFRAFLVTSVATKVSGTATTVLYDPFPESALNPTSLQKIDSFHGGLM